MRPLPEKFEELETLLLDHRRTLAQSTGVPFIRLVYHPDEEPLCCRRRETLTRALISKGLTVAEVSCRDVIFTHYEQRGRLEQLFALEAQDPDALRQNIQQHAQRELQTRLLTTATRLDDNGVIFLVDVGFLYPYLQLGPVLEACTNEITPPQALVIFYPGEQDTTGQLLFMGRRPSGYYRAHPLI